MVIANVSPTLRWPSLMFETWAAEKPVCLAILSAFPRLCPTSTTSRSRTYSPMIFLRSRRSILSRMAYRATSSYLEWLAREVNGTEYTGNAHQKIAVGSEPPAAKVGHWSTTAEQRLSRRHVVPHPGATAGCAGEQTEFGLRKRSISPMKSARLAKAELLCHVIAQASRGIRSLSLTCLPACAPVQARSVGLWPTALGAGRSAMHCPKQRQDGAHGVDAVSTPLRTVPGARFRHLACVKCYLAAWCRDFWMRPK